MIAVSVQVSYVTIDTALEVFMERYGGGRSSANGSSRGQQQQQQPWRRSYDIQSFSWPPRSYTCSFCKREFRSAQALGGHMNVHRRDRAMLRHYSPPLPWDSPNPNPNPNPNLAHIPNLNFSPPPPSSSSVHQPKISPAAYTFTTPLHSRIDRMPASTSTAIVSRSASIRDKENEGIAMKKSRVEEELDLELRLGYA